MQEREFRRKAAGFLENASLRCPGDPAYGIPGGNTQEAKKELLAICDFADSTSVFITPKPIRLLKRILEIATDRDSLVLDSFAGSGTTGHAVLAMNKQDGEVEDSSWLKWRKTFAGPSQLSA